MPSDGVNGDRRRCKAASKQTGLQCRNEVEPGMPTCRYHGGLTKTFPDRRGFFSKMPQRVRAAAEAALADGSLLDLRVGLALLRGVLDRHGELAAENETTEFRVRCGELLRTYKGGGPEADRAFAELCALVDRGVAEARAIEAVANAAERFQKRLEAAWGIRLAREQVVNVRDLTLVFTSLLSLARERLPEEIAREFTDALKLEIQRIEGLSMIPMEVGSGTRSRRRASTPDGGGNQP